MPNITADRFFDEKALHGTMSIDNLLNNFYALYQGDMFPLRPRTDLLLDNFEYKTDSEARTAYQENSGDDDISIFSESTITKFGNYSLKVTTIASPVNSPIEMVYAGAYNKDDIKNGLCKSGSVWLRTNKSGGSTIKFYAVDSSSNISYWDLVISAADTWEEISFDLTSPDSNSGTDADLTTISVIGFSHFEASATYYFDHLRWFVGNTVVVDGKSWLSGSDPYHSHVWADTDTPVNFERKVAPEIDLPTTDARYDLLVFQPVTFGWDLVWVEGTEGSSSKPDCPNATIPICYVRTKVGQSKVVNKNEADSNPTCGYLFQDCRPFLKSFLVNKVGGNASNITVTDHEITISIQAAGGTTENVLKIMHNGIQFYNDDGTALVGSKFNKFSDDATLAGNDSNTAVSEKAIKAALAAVTTKHYHHGGVVQVDATNHEIDVPPRTIWVDGITLSRATILSADVNVSANYIGTDMSGTAGFVYVYVASDGSGNYDVYLSGDAPNRSDCNTEITGKKLYREFNISGSDVWCRFIGARLKDTATTLVACRCDESGHVSYEAVQTVVSASNPNSDYDAKVPITSRLGSFQLQAAYRNEISIKPVNSPDIAKKRCRGEYMQITSYMYNDVDCSVTDVSGTNKISVKREYSMDTKTNYVYATGYWESV